MFRFNSKFINEDKIITQVLETGEYGYLVSDKTIDGAYILRPKTGNYDEIQNLAQNIFKANNISKEKARIEIQNGTKEAGLAGTTAEQLKTMKYNIVCKIRNPMMMKLYLVLSQMKNS